MTPRAMRVILLLLAMAATGAAAYSIFSIEQRTAGERNELQAVREHVRGILVSILELRAGERSYVAVGQGHQFWTAHVTDLLVGVDATVRDLRSAVRSEAAAAAVDAAAVALDNFRKLDARAQEYVSLDQKLLASDLIFSDGVEMTGTAATQIDTALTQEIQAREQALATLRRQQGWTAAGAGGVLVLVMLLLAPLPARREAGAERTRTGAALEETGAPSLKPAGRDGRQPGGRGPGIVIDEPGARGLQIELDLALETPMVSAEPVPDLDGTARLCTELGRVMETREVPPLLTRAAQILDAAGLVVWVSDHAGVELRPVLSHGYPEKIVAQMRSIPRDAQNAAALAFRSGQTRVVVGTDMANGAVVVPLITPAGCVGVLAAELRHGSEQRESTRALATILAAQLATLVGAAPSTGAAQAQA